MLPGDHHQLITLRLREQFLQVVTADFDLDLRAAQVRVLRVPSQIAVDGAQLLHPGPTDAHQRDRARWRRALDSHAPARLV
jgi:hypothetical protein